MVVTEGRNVKREVWSFNILCIHDKNVLDLCLIYHVTLNMPPKCYVRRSHPESSRRLLPCRCEVGKCKQEFPRSDKLRGHYKTHVILTSDEVTPPSRLSLIPDLKEKDKLHTQYFFTHSLHPSKIRIKPIPAPSNILGPLVRLPLL